MLSSPDGIKKNEILMREIIFIYWKWKTIINYKIPKRERGLKVVNRIFSIAQEKVTDPLLRKNVGTFLVKKLLYKEYL